MKEKMEVLESLGTWILVDRPFGVDIVGSEWVFTIKYHLDGSLKHYKTRLVIKGFIETYDIESFDTSSFFDIAKSKV